MKKYYVLLAGAILTATMQSQAQTKIGGSGAPDNSAMLEVTGGTGNNKGILPPRLTVTQRDAIPLPATGLMVYNTTANQLQVNTGTPAAPVWTTAGNSNSWNLNGNAATNPAANFIGTTNNQPLVMRTNAIERVRVDSTTGNVGINDATPRAPLAFGSAQGPKIRLYDNNTDTLVYGFSISNASLNYIVENTDLAAHRFWSGGSNDNGTELMRIQGNGNVGIATASPQQTLHVQGTARVTGSSGTPATIAGRNAAGDIGNVAVGAGLSLTNGTLSAIVAPSGWGLSGNAGTTPGTNYLGTADAQPLVMRTNAIERLRIAANGNVGISNATPISPLSFAPTLGTKVAFYDGGIANQYLGIGVSSSQLNYHVGSNSDHVFFAGGSNGDGTELMRMRSDGNMGIGTAAPTARLDVNGTARIQGSAGVPTAITGRDAAGNVGSISLGSNLTLTNGVLSASGGGTAGWGLTGNAGTNPATNFIGTTDAQPVAFHTNGTEKVRIGTNGFLGIGTNSPGSRLHMVSDGLGAGITDDVLLASYGPNANSTLPTFFFQAATGTAAAPGNTANNTQMGSVQFNAVVSGTVATQSGITSNYTGNGNTHGANLAFLTRQPGSAAFAQRMIIDPTGNVGIGTATPNNHVQIAKDDYGQFGGLAVSDIAGANASNFTITPGYYGSVASFGVTLDVTGEAPIGFSDPIIPAANNAFSCGTSAFRWSTVYAVNGTINTSDARMKKNVRDLNLGLDAVLKLHPVVYDWKDDSGKDKIGFIAQELRKVVPNVVVGNESKETLGVLYSDMVPVLTRAIQEQQAQIAAQEQKINALITENAALKENKVTTAQLMERVKQMEQMLGVKEIEGSSKAAGK